MLEKEIEAHLVRRVKEAGGTAYKCELTGLRSVPDRLVLMPGGRALFVECKRPGAKPTPAQAREHDRLRALGFTVEVIDTKDKVEELMLWA